jgi:phage tail-like protein
MGLLQETTTITKPDVAGIAPLILTSEIPIPAYQFSIEFDEGIVALFQRISGMTVHRAVEPVTVGGMPNYTLELPGQISYDHVTFEGGLSSSDFFYNWMMAGSDLGGAISKNFFLVQRRPEADGFKPVRRWSFINAYPVKWTISDLGATDTDKIVIESLELSFDYFGKA